MLQARFNALADQWVQRPCRGILLAVSGGVDSMVMARLFRVWRGARLEVAHADFGLRGEESTGDRAFVEAWAREAGLVFHSRVFDTRGYARERGLSIEMAARELRYAWFAELTAARGLDYIALGHHAHDQAETFFLNLARGTGLRGLCGMQPVQGQLLRLLLSFSRPQIADFARQQGLAWREDRTNAQDLYLRNKVRHQVLPLLEELNPAALEAVCGAMDRLSQARACLQAYVQELQARCARPTQAGEVLRLDLQTLRETGHTAYLLHEWLYPLGFPARVVEALSASLAAQEGGTKVFEAPDYRLYAQQDALVVRHAVRSVGKEDVGKEGGDEDGPAYARREFDKPADYKPLRDPAVACLDADRVQEPLTWRPWQPGDRFRPLGMQGFKKVSDFLVDQKVPLYAKAQVYVLLSAGQVVWIAGHRIDDRFKVTSQTRRVLELRLL